MAPTPDGDALERRIQERGRRLLAAVEPQRLLHLTPAWWQERLFEWATRDPTFRVKLLRFVDVLPALRSAQAVADHVRQYFREGAPGPVALGSRVGGQRPFRPVLSRVVRQGVFAMADRFIAGRDAQDALPKLRALAEAGVASTLDVLGEATLSAREADGYRERYLHLLDTLAAASTAWNAPEFARTPNISVKLSALTPHFEPAAPEAVSRDIQPRLLPILRRARELGAGIYVDMEQYRYRDLVHRVFADALLEEGLEGWDGAGIVVQAYLRDALDVLEWLEDLARRTGRSFAVRLVKGAYWDEERVVARQLGHPVPVFEEKSATDWHFERCTERLLRAWPHLRPAFGTHNPRSIAQAMVRAEEAGLPPEALEFQTLYGMAEGLRRAVSALGYRTRVYVPVGELIPGMGYLVRRLLENTANESWIVHKFESADPEEVLRPPAPPAPASLPVRAAPFRNHPAAEWHLPAHREAMRQALAREWSKFGRRIGPLVGGRELPGRELAAAEPPAHPGTLLAEVSYAGPDEADEAAERARRAFPAWRDAGARRRGEILRHAADLLAARRWEFAALMVHECAKPWREADGDVVEAVDYLRYYALQAERLELGEHLDLVPGERNRTFREGRGVAAIIAPWNFPLAIMAGMTAAALAAGCCAIVKPAEESPVVARRFVDLLHEAGVPPDVVHFLPGRGEVVGEALVRHPQVDVIAFTGSAEVGLHILAVAASSPAAPAGPKRVVAEMGGKNAVIVDEDADIDEAVLGVVASAFGYAGQKCSACSRVIVVGSAAAEFRERLAGAVESLPVGLPEDPWTVVPPLISDQAKEKVEQYLRLATREGRLLARGDAPSEGRYVAPQVFEGLPPTSAVAREEIFGPVLTLFTVDRFDEALALANDAEYALTGGVFSRNPRNIALAMRDFRVGNLYINRKITGAMVGRQPFGGFRRSGLGDKAGGPDTLIPFTVPRVVTENTLRRGFAEDLLAR
ncbi:1-pyrroline-5-carboxylate dehydrogenase 1 [bacterium HR29]|nr:1-pyrroline-5-carboxylate dehydrogenase 1 [bacterium HR29]